MKNKINIQEEKEFKNDQKSTAIEDKVSVIIDQSAISDTNFNTQNQLKPSKSPLRPSDDILEFVNKMN